MTEAQIREILLVLEEEEKALTSRLEQIPSIKGFFRSMLPNHQHDKQEVGTQSTFSISGNSASIQLHNQEEISGFTYKNFPKDQSLDTQILYLFNEVGRILRISDLEKEYKNTEGNATRVKIEGVCRKLKGKGLLTAARFNSNWTMVFYGLPEWVEVDENGNKTFKEQYRPSKRELPFGYDTIDFDYSKKG
ncbi:hypothetical protein [Rufibacter hautae]|uniref:Uncharacterized protein n=1 Tax=Rufibacter hautae TaxID=2595005 RepID=A0A5B6TVJ4_9BACT|nr:hypothetical protein [Rufibacter hautae]KAA3440588.1 hypothetical protein FOA19_08035 [Rufibacter hautae]